MRRMERQGKRREAASRLSVRSAATLAVALAVVALAVFAVTALFGWVRPVPAPNAKASEESVAVAVPAASGDMSVTAGVVEIPDLLGVTLKEARIVLRAAGLATEVDGADAAADDDKVVTGQDPAAGVLAAAGTAVKLTVSDDDDGADVPAGRWVVCIDPGHQANEDTSPEPIGPGAKVTKQAATAGTTGVVTGIPEYELALQLSNNLKGQLERRGVRVVLTRSVNDVSMSNAERAAVANRHRADLFVRIHGSGSPDPQASGIITLYPASNTWTRPHAAASRSAAVAVQRAVIAETRANDLGTAARGDIAGFNYSKVPSILVECGLMSNPVEDRLLASPHYQDKLCAGIADGIVEYLRDARGK